MKYNFCTLFDRNYLYKGLALYNSLIMHCPDFVLWILCMDDITYRILKKLDLQKAILIRYADFEDDELRRIKPTRTVAEFCWTCTPSLPWYIIQKNPTIDIITYLDADLLFFSNPEPIYKEFSDNSVMIIEHRFPDHLKHLEVNGIYNVQMMVFRNDEAGLECLEWWKDRCNEWCYYRLEDGKLGDQKYLDDWTTRFRGVHVLQHKGSGVALWNVMRYQIAERGGKVYVDDDPFIFYHFHQFQLLIRGSYDYGEGSTYTLTPENIELIYKPYIRAIEKAISQVSKIDRAFNCGFKLAKKDSLMDRVLRLPSAVKNRFNKIYGTVRNGT